MTMRTVRARHGVVLQRLCLDNAFSKASKPSISLANFAQALAEMAPGATAPAVSVKVHDVQPTRGDPCVWR
jgi:hypothetical protein